MPEPDQRQPLAITLETPPGVDARTLAHNLLAFLQEEYGASVETQHDADGEAGRYVVHIDPRRVPADPVSD